MITRRGTDRAGLQRWHVHGLGVLMLLSYLSLTTLSYVQAAVLWQEAEAARTRVFFEGLAAALQPLLPAAPAWLLENGLLANAEAVILSYWVPLGLASLIVLALIVFVGRSARELDAGVPRALFIWALVFAAVSLPAYPVYTQDFWLSAVWGRMIASGVNPYETNFTPEFIGELPLDHFPMPMSYGPVWGLVSAGVTLLAGMSTLWTAVLFKLLIGALWAGALAVVVRITADASVRDRCLALLAFGWLPLGATQSLAEGHNDIAMSVMALVWLALLLRERTAAPIGLALSALSKYVTGPLIAIDAIHELRVRRIPVRRYVLRLIIPGLIAAAVLALLYRSTGFFDGVRLISAWHFLQPRDAVQAIELLAGVTLWPLPYAANALLPVVAVYYLGLAWTEPGREATLKAIIALMSAIVFAGVSHVWPWYLAWVLPFAAIRPQWWLSRFVIGASALAPFTLAAWWVEPFPHHREIAALALYAGGLLWMLATRATAFAPAALPAADAVPATVTTRRRGGHSAAE